MEPLPDPVMLPCGCFLNPVVTAEGVRELRISACRQDCVHLANALGLSREMGKPIEYRER